MPTERMQRAALLTATFLGLALAGCAADKPDPVEPASPSSYPTRSQVLQSHVETLLERTGLPGLVVAIAKGDQEPIVAAAGYADTKQMMPLQPDTPFFIGSISKNVFAVIALQLVEEGRLGLEDPLSAYLEWPRGDEITIRMLMNHTSGIPDYFGSLSLLDSADGVPKFFSEPRTPADIIRMMPSREPTFDPGTDQSYSNTNGLLVGQVIEKVEGRSLGEILDKRIVSRLDLKNTYLYNETTFDLPRARGYCGMPGWVTAPGQFIDCSFADEALPNSADGSIVSTAGDLLRYHQALRGGELLDADSWKAMRHLGPGLDNGLGYLIMTGPQGDHQGNIGRAMGHLAANIYYLDKDLFVVMMLNRGDAPLPMRQFLDMWLEPRQEHPTDLATSTLTVAAPVHHLDNVAREPMLVEHPSGALFVSGYGSQVTGVDPKAPPNLWRSDDRGATWGGVDIGTPEDGAIGNSDVDLAVGPDGTLYFVSMGFNRSTFEGTHIAVGVSRDIGASWTWTLLSESRFDDRPWVAVAPDGTGHVIWNDGSGVSYAISTDDGETWLEREKIHPQGGSSHLAVGPTGELAVRISPISGSGHMFDEGLELIAVSTDAGKTWDKHKVPGEIEWDPTLNDPSKVPRWVEPLAWDADGALYHLWSEGTAVKLARSEDHGTSWGKWLIAEEEDVAFFPYLVARGPGELAATWFSGRGDGMVVNVSLIQVPKSSSTELRVLRAEPFQPDTWREGENPRVRDPGGEYVPVVFLSDGGLGVVTTVQDSQDDRFGFTWWKVEAPPDDD